MSDVRRNKIILARPRNTNGDGVAKSIEVDSIGGPIYDHAGYAFTQVRYHTKYGAVQSVARV